MADGQIRSSFLDRHFTAIVVIVVGLFLYFKPGNKPQDLNVYVTDRDTAITNHTGTNTTGGGMVVQSIPYPVDRWKFETKYLPDTGYARLLQQYLDMRAELFTTNIQRDSTAIDSIGMVWTTDTVFKNNVIGRKWNWNIRERTITNTVVLPPKRQFYLNGILQGTTAGAFTGIGTGLTYKDRRERMYSANGMYSPQNGLTVQVGAHWKIKLGK